MFAIALAGMRTGKNEGLLLAGYHLEYLETYSILEQLNYHTISYTDRITVHKSDKTPQTICNATIIGL